MTDNELVTKMVEEGAALGITSLPPMALAVAEILPNNRLFWVQLGAEDQHHVHSIEFDDIEQMYNGRSLKFIVGGKMVGYVAPFTDWPQLDTDELTIELCRWKQELKDDGCRRAFDRFVAGERAIHIHIE